MIIDKILIAKFIKFCIVGFSGVFVDFGITWLAKERLRANKYLANSIGFICAASSNYLLNRYWTFQSHKNEMVTEYFSFIGISIIGLGINNLIIYILTEKFKLNFYVSKIIATIIVTVWNFFANYLFTFKQ